MSLWSADGAGFDGFAIGGLSVGEENQAMYDTVEWTTPFLPYDKPRYLMGVGTPEDLVENIERGVDMFDCVMPTRNARNGTLFTSFGKVNIKAANIFWIKILSTLSVIVRYVVDTQGLICATCIGQKSLLFPFGYDS